MIYENVKKACGQKNISIRKLETDLEFSNGSVCKWDRHRPSIDSVKKVADYLGLTIDNLLQTNQEDKT